MHVLKVEDHCFNIGYALYNHICPEMHGMQSCTDLIQPVTKDIKIGQKYFL